ncbi:uncharacterized protein LOC124450443 isoform X2 [Xenia sp. Carnegie-2017]|uniref:uncharacterized protein LOC124450443 isoform X2 n=1 Tax=Xenia sp. Carnegie-2017 TaxID=2897299 RepID=UPI001F034F89|nr:uncharacterized protein LOC124450443 isoform X2 [Xenia sp. Carnegie-2017]
MMTEIRQCSYSLIITVILVFSVKEANGFFIKHVQSGKCIYDTGAEYSRYPRNIPIHLTYYLNLTKNCFDSTAQFKFHQSGSILKLNREGCLNGERVLQDLLLIYEKKGDIAAPCNEANALTQTFQGGIFTADFNKCAVPPGYIKRHVYMGIAQCNDEEDQRFHFGSVACAKQKIANASCSKNQYMVIKVAEYRGLSKGSSCGSNYDYSCHVDVTCDLKNYCDGRRECNITVDDNHFSSNICPGLEKYLYFEYQCNDTSMPYRKICNLQDVSLSQSNLPNEGLVDVFTMYRNFTICNNGLLHKEKTVVCEHFGYPTAASLEGSRSLSSSMHRSFIPGNVKCDAQVNDLSQCAITQNNACSQYSYLTCHICDRPLLNNTRRFPDSSFTASALTEGHSAANARISSGSSWCAPAANGNHYLQLNFGKLYAINTIAIFGDNTSPSWIASYYVNTTFDLTNWESVFHTNSQKLFKGNKNAYNDAAISSITGGIRTKALRLIPIKYHGRPCLRTEVCGGELLPNSPINLRVNSTASRYVTISWVDPQNVAVSPSTGLKNPLTNFKFILWKQTMVIFNFIEQANVSRPYRLNNLIPNKMYTVDVYAGNSEGFGDAANASFHTNEDVPESPPSNISISMIRSLSFVVMWEPPDINKRNGEIVDYTVCITDLENLKCLINYTTKEQSLKIDSLKPMTKYYIRVLASTKIGPGNYSESKMAITNGLPLEAPLCATKTTLTFSLKTPKQRYAYFFVIAMKGNEKNSSPPFKYGNHDLVTYSSEFVQPKPYIAAVFAPKYDGVFMFTLGDGSNTSIAGTRTRRSTDGVYYNGPLKANSTYRIFLRFVINEQGLYYSTDWSYAAKTGPSRSAYTTLRPSRSAYTTPRPSRSAHATLCPSRSAHTTLCSTSNSLKSNKEDGKLLPIVIALAICLLLSLTVNIYQLCYRRKNISNKDENHDNKKRPTNVYDGSDIHDNNYEHVDGDQSSYMSLKSTGRNEDDHVYCHLNEVSKNESIM